MKRKRWTSLHRKKTSSRRTDDAFYRLPAAQPLSDECRRVEQKAPGFELNDPVRETEGSALHEDYRFNANENNAGSAVDHDQEDIVVEDMFETARGQVLTEHCEERQEDASNVNANFNDGIAEGEQGLVPLCWSTLASLLVNTGTKRFTEEHYEVFAGFINWLSPNDKLPSLSTVKRNIRPYFRSVAFVKTHIKRFPVDFAKSGARAGVRLHYSEKECPVAIVKPSDWAKADIATECIQELVTRSSRREEEDIGEKVLRPIFSCIEDAPIVRNRLSCVEVFKIRRGDNGYSDLTVGVELVANVRNTFNVRRAASQAGFHPRVEGDDIRIYGKVLSLQVYDIVHDNISAEDDREGRSEGNTKGRRRKRKKKESLRNSPPFLSGDLVVQFAPGQTSGSRAFVGSTETEKDYNAYIVFRCWIRERMRDDFRSSIVFLENTMRPETWNQGVKYIRELARKVIAIPNDGVSEENGREIRDDLQVIGGPHGVLQDGRKYIVYRFLLYSDGFTPKQGSSGSMGGCYMLPLGILPNDRSAIGAIRRIALTPSGVSTNEVIKFIMEDILTGTVEGFPTRNSKGEEIVVFLDCVGFIADYPAISETMDVLGHTSNVPCHLCFFSRYDKSGSGGSRYGYTSDIHCGHPSFCRNEARLSALRKADIPDEELRGLGMESFNTFESGVNALHKLSVALKEARRRVPLSELGYPVVPSVFDTYRSSIVAPDHLFLGLGMDVLNSALRHLPPKTRRDAEVYAKDALLENDLIYQNHLINQDGTSVNSMQISAMYSFLLVAPHAFRTAWMRALQDDGIRMTDRDKENVVLALDLLEHFQRLVSLTQYQPIADVDGLESLRWYNRDDGRSRLNELQESALSYINSLDDLWKRSPKAKELDKPNVHRLLEFYMFTLPNFGNVRLIEELVFENAHQDMKRGVTRSNFQNAQLQSMEHVLANDWVNRLAVEIEDVGIDGSNFNSRHCRSVLRLLGRPEWKFRTIENIIGDVRSMFPPPMLQLLKTRRRRMSSLIASKTAWEGGPIVPERRDEEDENGDMVKQKPSLREDVVGAKRFLYDLVSTDLCIQDTNLVGPVLVPQCEVLEHVSAKWLVRYGSIDNVTRCITTVRYGTVIQSLTTRRNGERASRHYVVDVEAPPGAFDAQRAFWVVVAIFSTGAKRDRGVANMPRKSIYVLALPCLMEKDVAKIDPTQRARVLIKMSENVRRVMALHRCGDDRNSNGCTVTTDGQGKVEHDANILEGGRYVIYGRREGFPPRCG